MGDGEPIAWDALLDGGWDRDCRIAARVCDPAVDIGGYLGALWERQQVQERGGLWVWVEPHSDEAAQEDAER